MRICHVLCVGLALLLSSCASWHRPDIVYRGRNISRPTVAAPQRVRPVFPEEEDDAERPNGPQLFDLGAPTLTPPIDSTTHRTGYRSEGERARPVRRDRPALQAPGPGYVELPPAPDLP